MEEKNKMVSLIIIFQPITAVTDKIGSAAGQNNLTLFEQIIFFVVAIVITQLVNTWIAKKKRDANRIKDSETIKSQLVNTFADDQAKFRKEVMDRYEKERKDNVELIATLEAYKSEYGDLTEQYCQLNKKYNELHDELTAIRKELIETRKERDSLQGRVQTLEDEKGQLEKEVRKLQGILNNMGKKKR